MGKKRIRTRELVCQAQYESKKGSRVKTVIPDSFSWDRAEYRGGKKSI